MPPPPPEPVAEPIQSATIVILQPGSFSLRLGRATDAYPQSVPHCIARRHKQPGQLKPTEDVWMCRPEGQYPFLEATRIQGLNTAQESLGYRPMAMGTYRKAANTQQLARVNHTKEVEETDVPSPFKWTDTSHKPEKLFGDQESEDESDESEESEDERQRREQQERKEKDRKKEKKREESKRSKAPATVDEELASRFATVSYRARDSGTRLHLCEVDGSTMQAWHDKVRAIRPAAVVWRSGATLSVPGVEVLVVDDGWEVRGLQGAESRGHKTVAVAPWCVDIKPLLDHITVRRDPAATDVWLLRDYTDTLCGLQQQLDKDSRYRRIN